LFTPIRRTRLGAVVVMAALLLVASALSAAAATTVKSAASSSVLGTPKKATGTAITIGIVGDGKNDTLDDTDRLNTAAAVVKYANAYRGGLNGHVIKIDQCVTHNSPSGGTQCGVQMVNDHVAAVIVGASGQNDSIFKGLGASHIPFFIYAAASPDILTSPDAYSVTNVIGALTAPIAIAKAQNITKMAVVVIDQPEAITAAKSAITPFFTKAGITLDVIPAPASTADLSPQIQQAIANGDKAFLDIAVPRSLIAIKQSGFTGPTMVVAGIEKADAANVPGGVKGFYIQTNTTLKASDPDVKLMNAIMAKYVPSIKVTPLTASEYSVMLAFVDALKGATTAVDAPTVHTALDTMKATKLPVGGGITFQCGVHQVSFLPATCSSQTLTAQVSADGTPGKFTVVDTAQYLKLS
jgi:branched-chain amino acid transport system substrate-binding protein